MRRAWRSFLVVRFDRFSSYRNYNSSSFCPKHGLRSDLRVPNCKNFPGGAPPNPPPSLFTLTRTQWPYHSKIVGAGPVTVFPRSRQTWWCLEDQHSLCKWHQLYFPLLCLSSEHGRGYEVGVGNTDGNFASSLSASSESKLEYNHVLNSVTCL